MSCCQIPDKQIDDRTELDPSLMQNGELTCEPFTIFVTVGAGLWSIHQTEEARWKERRHECIERSFISHPKNVTSVPWILKHCPDTFSASLSYTFNQTGCPSILCLKMMLLTSLSNNRMFFSFEVNLQQQAQAAELGSKFGFKAKLPQSSNVVVKVAFISTFFLFLFF